MQKKYAVAIENAVKVWPDGIDKAVNGLPKIKKVDGSKMPAGLGRAYITFNTRPTIPLMVAAITPATKTLGAINTKKSVSAKTPKALPKKSKNTQTYIGIFLASPLIR